MSKRPKPPVTVYTIVCRDNKFISVNAKLVGYSGSWWIVEHNNGKQRKYNGGKWSWDRGCHLSISEAWAAEMRAIGVAIAMSGVSEKAVGGIVALYQKLADCTRDCFQDGFVFGKLLAEASDE